MKEVNINNMFQLFQSEEGIEDEGNGVYIDLKETPAYWIQMFLNYTLNADEVVTNIIESSDSEMDIQDVERAREYIIYHRAWSFIEKIDITNNKHLIAINKKKDDGLLFSLDEARDYFERFEDFEKCAFLRDIISLLS